MWLIPRILFGAGLLAGGLVLTVAVLASLDNKLAKDPEVISLMTYKSAIEYFVQNRPTLSEVKKGALMREAHSKGYLVSQVFLDDMDEIVCKADGTPYGRKVVVRQFDEELTNSFRGTNMIIIA